MSANPTSSQYNYLKVEASLAKRRIPLWLIHPAISEFFEGDTTIDHPTLIQFCRDINLEGRFRHWREINDKESL